MRSVTTVLVLTLCAVHSCALAEADHPMLLPTPKKIEWLDGSIKLSIEKKPLACIVGHAADKAIATGIKQLNERLEQLGAAALPVAANPSDAAEFETTVLVCAEGGTGEMADAQQALPLPAEAQVPDGYILQCQSGGRNVIACIGHDPRGCYYGIQTLTQLMSEDGGTVSVPRVNITDWPTFRLRLVKAAPCGSPADMVARWADMMPRYKASVLATQFQSRGDTGTWQKPSELFVQNAETIGRTARELGTCDAFIYYGPFGKGRGSLTDPKVVDDYVEKLEYWISRGYSWVAIDFNDWFQARHLTEDEREKIGGLADCWIMLTKETYKRVRAKYPSVGIATVLSAGYYKNATPEVIKYCKNVPEDILVVSVGPTTTKEAYCSPVNAEFLKDWAAKTGRKPFYWDNCLYRQLDHYAPFINRIYNFDSYANRFPPNFADLVSGPGIHLNGGPKKWWEPGVLTFLDYTWNPEAYNAEESLRKARVLLWGKPAADAAVEAQKTLAEFYGYLHDAHENPGKVTREDADRRFAVCQKAVDKLKALLKDPVIDQELDEHCLDRAEQKLGQLFAPPKPAK